MQVAIKHEETKEDHVFLSKMKESGLIIKTKRENVSAPHSFASRHATLWQRTPINSMDNYLSYSGR